MPCVATGKYKITHTYSLTHVPMQFFLSTPATSSRAVHMMTMRLDVVNPNAYHTSHWTAPLQMVERSEAAVCVLRLVLSPSPHMFHTSSLHLVHTSFVVLPLAFYCELVSWRDGSPPRFPACLLSPRTLATNIY